MRRSGPRSPRSRAACPATRANRMLAVQEEGVAAGVAAAGRAAGGRGAGRTSRSGCSPGRRTGRGN